MDPVSLVSILVEVLALCEKAVEQLKKFWNAAEDLKTFITKVALAQRTTQSILAVIRELKAAGLTSVDFSLDSYINPLRLVIGKIMDRVRDVLTTEAGKPRSKFVQKVRWTFAKDRMDALEKELGGLEDGMTRQVNAINLLVTMKYLSLVRAGTLATTDSKHELHDAFSDSITFVDSEGEAADDEGQVMRTWLGSLNTDKHDNEYVEMRQQLADAAKYGHWDELFAVLESGRNTYGESWVNAPRIKTGDELNLLSLWTPLHQAVYMGAPVEVVSRLLRLGASKTLRTRWTEFPWTDMTPLELAQHLSVKHLIDLLRPVIHVPIPTDTLNILQEQFHELIKRDMGDDVEAEEWWLPQLEPLLEFEPREWTWFPTARDNVTGYWYRIDGRGLLVQSETTGDEGTKQRYRIAADGIFEIQEALVA